MNIIDIQPYERSESDIKAEQMLLSLNDELSRRVAIHKQSYVDFWSDPHGVLRAMGTNTGIFLTAAAENVRHIATLAHISGKDFGEFLPEDCWKPKAQITINSDGTAFI